MDSDSDTDSDTGEELCYDEEELERKYGYFECRECGHRWESAHVYCKEDTEKAVYRQDCRECDRSCKPYRVDDIECPDCLQIECVCQPDEPTNPGEPEEPDDRDRSHRSDLCEKCHVGIPCT